MKASRGISDARPLSVEMRLNESIVRDTSSLGDCRTWGTDRISNDKRRGDRTDCRLGAQTAPQILREHVAESARLHEIGRKKSSYCRCACLGNKSPRGSSVDGARSNPESDPRFRTIYSSSLAARQAELWYTPELRWTARMSMELS
jgi:hypothetical protein